MVIYYAPMEAVKQTQSMSPEDMKKGMDKWFAWSEKIGSALVDMGTPLMPGQKISESGSTPSTKDVTGYSILQAEDIEKAKELLKDHPHLGWADGCEIEVYECMHLPGQ